MPLTPFHVLPAASVYLLFFRRLNGLAFFFGTLLIDIEPILYMFFGVGYPQISLLFGGFARLGYHMITHNPFTIVILVAPAMLLLTKLVEFAGQGLLLKILSGVEWINYSWKQTYLSALFDAFLHLGWDLTMHEDINLGFPFVSVPNPFLNSLDWSLILEIGLIMILPAYFIGKRLNRGNPFKKLP